MGGRSLDIRIIIIIKKIYPGQFFGGGALQILGNYPLNCLKKQTLSLVHIVGSFSGQKCS